MKYLLTTFTTIIAVGMFVTASPVLANGGRECVLDPDTGTLVPPNGSGACFTTDLGFDLFIFEESDGEFVLAAERARRRKPVWTTKPKWKRLLSHLWERCFRGLLFRRYLGIR